MSTDVRCDKEIKMRIGQAKTAFYNIRDLLKRDINLKLRKRLMKCYVW